MNIPEHLTLLRKVPIRPKAIVNLADVSIPHTILTSITSDLHQLAVLQSQSAKASEKGIAGLKA